MTHNEYEEKVIDELGPIAQRDIVRMLCGDLLGYGVGRRVFLCALDETRVVKIESDARSFQNVAEWQLWDALRGTKYEQYLAPCYDISPGGCALIQARVQKLPTLAALKAAGADLQKLREMKLPEFLTDLKTENYGWYKGRVVCMDYGSHLATNHGAFGSKMRKVKWLV